MKQTQIKVYSFGRECIADGEIVSANLEENKITLTDSFLNFALECFIGKKFESGQLVDAFIKVMLPNNEEAAKLEWENGLFLNDKKYFAWFATTGGMKKEDASGKCETIFIREDFKLFTDEFEGLISLGKFKEIEQSKKEMCINKDILSRISLGVSSCYPAGDMPDIIVLPQPHFRIIKDYKTLEKFTVKVDDKDQVDYRLEDHHFDQDIDVFDGGAIATPDVFYQIESELGIDYPVEFAIIRGYGIGIKGMITKFDIIAYLKDAYTGDTAFCRKVNNDFQLLDMWNEWQTVTSNTMLLNESMVKLAKYYKVENGENMVTFEQRLAEVDPKYKDIIGKLYVTKVNKKDEDIENYRRTNYQLINALALSKADYFELIKDEVKSYKKILKPFDKASDKDEWLININAIRLFFKNTIKVNNEESEEFQVEASRIIHNVVTKCEELLNVSEDFIKLRFVRNNLAKLIEKKCREIASGKFTVKAKYQYIAVCPLSYVNYAMYRDQGTNGLQAEQFFSGDCLDADVRTISRNPLCAYSEVHNVSFIRNAELDNWLSPCREIIYFNQQSDILALMSSADTDGDACTVIDNEIIKNAVVIPIDGKYYINTEDGKKVEMEYNSQNRFLSTYKASGNLIGKISLKAASINSDCQNTPKYYDVISHNFIHYSEINKLDIEDKQALVQEKTRSGDWITTYKASEQHREYIRQRFYCNEKDIYIVLYNAMVSIDAPKTLYFPSSADMEVINKKYGRKAWFLQFRENKHKVNTNHYEFTFGLLDHFTQVIKEQLLDLIDKARSSFDQNESIIQEKLVNGDYNIDDYTSCFEDIGSFYDDYTEERKIVNKYYMSQKKKQEIKRDRAMENGAWDNEKEEIYHDTLERFMNERYRKYKEIDARYIVLVDSLLGKYDIATISNAISNLENCTEDFIINLFFPVFEYVNSKIQAKRYVFKKIEDGEISYLGERYRKIPVEAGNNSNIVKKLHIEEKKRLKAIDINAGVRVRVLDRTSIKLIETELNSNKHIIFDIKVDDGKVLLTRDKKAMLEVFPNQLQVGKYNLIQCSSVKFELMTDIAKSKMSFKLMITEITV